MWWELMIPNNSRGSKISAQKPTTFFAKMPFWSSICWPWWSLQVRPSLFRNTSVEEAGRYRIRDREDGFGAQWCSSCGKANQHDQIDSDEREIKKYWQCFPRGQSLGLIAFIFIYHFKGIINIYCKSNQIRGDDDQSASRTETSTAS